MTPEGRIKAKFNKGLKAIQERHPGMLWYRMPVLRGMGKPMLDYIICVNGYCIMVEAKRDINHELTPKQKAIGEEAQAAGAEVLIIRSETTVETALLYIESKIW